MDFFFFFPFKEYDGILQKRKTQIGSVMQHCTSMEWQVSEQEICVFLSFDDINMMFIPGRIWREEQILLELHIKAREK